jgi:hypothetical protein
MTTALTLADLTARTGLNVLDYLDQSVSIPVIAGPQAQGDLIVIPLTVLGAEVTTTEWSRSVDVGPTGVELLRSAAGGNPHTLVADDGICTWTARVNDQRDLALGILDTCVTAYLIHPEHGATGIAPGRYVIRRQRELGTGRLFGVVSYVAD